MFSRERLLATSLLSGIILASSVGCAGTGPFVGVFGVPIPVSPYFQDQVEDNFVEKERYDRVPILGPITSGGPAVALDPPSDDEIIRTLEVTHPVEGGIPFLTESQRSNVRIVKTLIADYVDPPRVVPKIGASQVHHAHYKCTIYYTRTTRGLNSNTVADLKGQLYVDHYHNHRLPFKR